jgi:hypothetical protein
VSARKRSAPKPKPAAAKKSAPRPPPPPPPLDPLRSFKKAPPPEWEPRWDGLAGPTEAQIDTALRVLKSSYFSAVRSWALQIARQVRMGKLAEEAIPEAIDSVLGQAEWCMFRHLAIQACLCSDFDLSEDDGEPEDTDVRRAARCLAHDIAEQVEAELAPPPGSKNGGAA